MFKTTTFAGIPMMTRRNRRALVVGTYLLLAGATVLLGVTKGMKFESPFWIILVFSGVSRAVFGALIPQETVSERRIEKPVDLGLAASGPRPDPPPDERDVALRNEAYFQAFRVVAMFSVIVFALIIMMQDPTSWARLNLLQVFGAVLVVLVLTLPQAILLWSHPDLLEENG